MLTDPLVLWLIALGGGALALDLVVHRKAHTIELKEAALWSVFYVIVAVAYGFIMWGYGGAEMAQLYFTGYILEKALSVDNLFVFGVIFSLYGIAPQYQHKILHLGILGAIIFRVIFVVLGVTFLDSFGGYAMLVFAIILTCVTVAMARGGDEPDIKRTWYYRFANRVMPVNTAFPPTRFFTHAGYATLAFPCLITIELADVMFAFDSVPAVIAVSERPIIIISSMLMAILGLRALYFVLEAIKRMVPLLEKAVICILGFIALKMFLHAIWDLAPTGMEQANLVVYKWFGTPWLDLHVAPHESLTVIGVLLLGAVALSPFVKGDDDVDEAKSV